MVADRITTDSIDCTLRSASIVRRDFARAPAKIEAFKQRMGWADLRGSLRRHKLNRDLPVTFTRKSWRPANGYNLEPQPHGEEAPGLSFFAKDESGTGLPHLFIIGERSDVSSPFTNIPRYAHQGTHGRTACRFRCMGRTTTLCDGIGRADRHLLAAI